MNINFQGPELKTKALSIFEHVSPVFIDPGLSFGNRFSPIGEGRIRLKRQSKVGKGHLSFFNLNNLIYRPIRLNLERFTPIAAKYVHALIIIGDKCK